MPKPGIPQGSPGNPQETEDDLTEDETTEATPSTETEDSGASDSTQSPTEVTFYDAKKVPPELQPTFKEMQAALTRKTQDLATQRKGLVEAEYKANLFDQLIGHPEIVQTLERIRDGQGSGTPQAEAEAEGPEDLDPAVSRVLSRALQPLQAQIEQLKVQLAAEKEAAAFKQAHPDYESVKDKMLEAWRANPAFTMEEAYRWARYEELTNQQQTTARRTRTAKAAVETPGVPAAAKKFKSAQSVTEAAEQALEQLGLRRDLIALPRYSED